MGPPRGGGVRGQVLNTDKKKNNLKNGWAGKTKQPEREGGDDGSGQQKETPQGRMTNVKSKSQEHKVGEKIWGDWGNPNGGGGWVKRGVLGKETSKEQVKMQGAAVQCDGREKLVTGGEGSKRCQAAGCRKSIVGKNDAVGGGLIRKRYFDRVKKERAPAHHWRPGGWGGPATNGSNGKKVDTVQTRMGGKVADPLGFWGCLPSKGEREAEVESTGVGKDTVERILRRVMQQEHPCVGKLE